MPHRLHALQVLLRSSNSSNLFQSSSTEGQHKKATLHSSSAGSKVVDPDDLLKAYTRPHIQDRRSGRFYQLPGLMPGREPKEGPRISLPRPTSIERSWPAIPLNMPLATPPTPGLLPGARFGALLMLRDAPGRKPDALRLLIS
jgi:hypothetical protein